MKFFEINFYCVKLGFYMMNRHFAEMFVEHPSVIADALTIMRVVISLFIMVLTYFFLPNFPMDLFLGLLLFGWLTDALDGSFARKEENRYSETSFIGKNDALADLVLVLSTQYYLSKAGFLSEKMNWFLYLVFIISVFQLLKTNSQNVFFEMFYSAVVYFIMFYYAIISNALIWIIMVIYLLFRVFGAKDHFLARVKHFLSLGKEGFHEND